MDFLYEKVCGDDNTETIKANRGVIYKQISSCCKDASITKGTA